MELTEIQKKLLAISKPRSEKAIKKEEERGAMKKELKKEVLRYLDSIVEWGQVEDEDNPDYLMSKSDLMKFAYHFANWQKKQMMKYPFDATVCKGGGATFLKEMNKDDIVKALESYSDGDKVKVIIIKEE